MKIAILGTRGIPNNYGGFEQCAEYLSVGLVKRGHTVAVYSPAFHPYNKSEYKGVKIINKKSPYRIFGTSATNFIYDYLCLTDAVKKDFDIILQLGLITSSLSIIFCRHRGKVIATNLDGLEWKRSKWNNLIQNITKKLEKYGVKYSDYLIADNRAIQEYISEEYNRQSELISYGALIPDPPEFTCLENYGIKDTQYLLTIARLEPENNLELMFDGYIKSNINIPYFVVGNHLTKYGDYLKDKYRDKGIIFLGGVYDKNHLDNMRFFAKFYLHGHSVGGTNPALLEAMAAKAFIFSHNNKFNKSVVGKDGAYFNNCDELSYILKDTKLLKLRNEYIKNNFKKIELTYTWSVIIDKYEKYFHAILNNKKI